jgi:hypothetical protein
MKRLRDYFYWRRSPDQFTTFAILYMIPMLHELDYPWWSWGGQYAPLLLKGLILTAIVITVLNVNLATILFFTIASTFYYSVTSFPENPNHITLLIFCNIAILASLIIQRLRMKPASSSDAIFASIKPMLRLILIAVLFAAGFHKFNTDFLNPEVSCVNFVLGLLETKASKKIFGIPLFVLTGLVVAGFGYFALRKYLNTPIGVRASGLTLVAMLILVLCAGLFLSNGDFRSTVVSVGAVVVLLWQLIEGPLLFVRRLQAPILLLSLILLGTIAASGVQMFPAVLLPLLFVFVPEHVFVSWRNRSLLRVGQWEVHSIYICLFLNFLGASLTYINESISSAYSIEIVPRGVSQVFFLLSIVLLLIPLARELLSADRKWRWEGVQVLDGKTPGTQLILPLILLLWGMTPYLGLRTTGNFSMFSNLKTEGPVSNHILLGSNPFKVWGYQEDRVRIIDIDEEVARVGHHYDSLTGNSLPVAEFRKLVTLWRESGRKVAMTYEYQSGPIRTLDIANDKNWANARRNWETFWLDFRPVQESEPNLCRW